MAHQHQRDEERHGLSRHLLRQRFQAEIGEAWHRSELGLWMSANHAEMAKIIEVREPDWADVAESFRLVGLRDLWGRFPSAATAHETWRRVHERLG